MASRIEFALQLGLLRAATGRQVNPGKQKQPVSAAIGHMSRSKRFESSGRHVGGRLELWEVNQELESFEDSPSPLCGAAAV